MPENLKPINMKASDLLTTVESLPSELLSLPVTCPDISKFRKIWVDQFVDTLYKPCQYLYLLATTKIDQPSPIMHIYLRYFDDYVIKVKDYHRFMMNKISTKYNSEIQEIITNEPIKEEEIRRTQRRDVIAISYTFVCNVHYFGTEERVKGVIDRAKTILTECCKDNSGKQFLDNNDDVITFVNKIFDKGGIRLLKISYGSLDALVSLIVAYHYLGNKLPYDKLMVTTSNTQIGLGYLQDRVLTLVGSRHYNMLGKSRIIQLANTYYNVSVFKRCETPFELFMVDLDKVKKLPFNKLYGFNNDIFNNQYLEYKKVRSNRQLRSIVSLSSKTQMKIANVISSRCEPKTVRDIAEIAKVLGPLSVDKYFIDYIKRHNIDLRDKNVRLKIDEIYKEYLVKSLSRIFNIGIKLNKVKSFLQKAVDKLNYYDIRDIAILYKDIQRSALRKHFQNIYEIFNCDKNVMYDIFEAMIRHRLDNFFVGFCKDVVSVSGVSITTFADIIRRHPILRWLVPYILRNNVAEGYGIKRFAEILDADYELGRRFVKTLSRFKYKTHEQVHDIIFFIRTDEKGIEALRKVIRFYEQLSPKSPNLVEETDAVRTLYRLYYQGKHVEDVDKMVSNITTVSQLAKYIQDIEKAIKESEVREYIETVKILKDSHYLNDKQIYRYAMLMSRSKHPDLVDIIKSPKIGFYEYDVDLDDKYKIYFRGWDSVFGCFAPDDVDCCAGVEFNKFRSYATNSYTYNLSVVDKDENNVVLWALLVIAHDKDDNLYLVLDNIEVPKKYRPDMQRKLTKILLHTLNYLSRMNLPNLVKDLVLIGKMYNDIDVTSVSKSIDNDFEPVIPISYSDAFGYRFIYKVDLQTLTTDNEIYDHKPLYNDNEPLDNQFDNFTNNDYITVAA